MKKVLLIAATVVVGILIGSVVMGTALAATPTPQGTPTPGAGGYSRGGMMGGGMRGGMVSGEMGMEDEVLALLHMTREQVVVERQAGKSLVQIAQAKNVTEQQLVNTILAAKRADLDKLVTDGKLTQAQADLMYQNMQQTVPQAVNRTTTGPMWGNGNANPGDCPMWDDDSQTPGAGQPGRGGMMNGRGGMRGGRGT
jgi:hypothetical protein